MKSPQPSSQNAKLLAVALNGEAPFRSFGLNLAECGDHLTVKRDILLAIYTL